MSFITKQEDVPYLVINAGIGDTHLSQKFYVNIDSPFTAEEALYECATIASQTVFQLLADIISIAKRNIENQTP